MNFKNILYGVIGLLLLSACNRNEKLLTAKDSDLTIELMQLKKEGDGSATLSYQARLIPQKQLLAAKNGTDKNALFYKMDSCFYINTGKQKIYAALVQPVANGVSGTYEYLLQFEVGEKEKATNFNIVYQDRYLNKKAYILDTDKAE